MTDITRSWLPTGQALICARLRCDGCGRFGAPFTLGDTWELPADLARLLIRCRRRGWRRRILAGADGPVRADYCRSCARLRRSSGQ